MGSLYKGLPDYVPGRYAPFVQETEKTLNIETQ